MQLIKFFFCRYLLVKKNDLSSYQWHDFFEDCLRRWSPILTFISAVARVNLLCLSLWFFSLFLFLWKHITLCFLFFYTVPFNGSSFFFFFSPKIFVLKYTKYTNRNYRLCIKDIKQRKVVKKTTKCSLACTL